MTPMTFGAGASTGQPDTCKTPSPAGEVPVPYVNVASNSMAVPSYYTIMIQGQPELNLGGTYSATNGDEAGVGGGVASGTFSGPGKPMQGSMIYYVGGMPSWRVTATTVHNTGNSPGTSNVPSQTIKIVNT